ncbi:MAG: YkoF family thiamine/hydroxymethylpyrimidine-binding protein [Thermaerobacterales bacterium]
MNAKGCAPDAFFGCRFSLYPMTDGFVPVILNAVKTLDEPGIEVQTDDVSTCLVGDEGRIFAALQRCLARAAASGDHVVMNATFSKG